MLTTMRPHIFFDDQKQYFVPTGIRAYFLYIANHKRSLTICKIRAKCMRAALNILVLQVRPREQHLVALNHPPGKR